MGSLNLMPQSSDWFEQRSIGSQTKIVTTMLLYILIVHGPFASLLFESLKAGTTIEVSQKTSQEWGREAETEVKL